MIFVTLLSYTRKDVFNAVFKNSPHFDFLWIMKQLRKNANFPSG